MQCYLEDQAYHGRRIKQLNIEIMYRNERFTSVYKAYQLHPVKFVKLNVLNFLHF